MLDIPSRRFYATTGFPLKAAGEVPPDMLYLGASERIGALRNLSKDVSLAARNALLEMIDYMTETYGLTQEQAYVVASVAVDLRIGQLVDAPNVGVTALLPLDIFTSPHGDLPAVPVQVAAKYSLVPRPVRPPVEHDQVTGPRRAAVHVGRRLLHAFVNRPLEPLCATLHSITNLSTLASAPPCPCAARR